MVVGQTTMILTITHRCYTNTFELVYLSTDSSIEADAKGWVINCLWGGSGVYSYIFDGVFVPPLRFM